MTVRDGRMVRDGIWLSMGAAFTSVAGLIGWLVSAHLASRQVVGTTTAFTSGFLLVASLSQFSLGPAVLRWIPRAGGRTAALLSRAYLVIISGTLVGVGVFFALPAGRSTLAQLPGWGWPLFTVTTLVWAVMQFQDPVLTSVGKAGVVLVKNLGFGIGRVGILLVAGSAAGALGIRVVLGDPGGHRGHRGQRDRVARRPRSGAATLPAGPAAGPRRAHPPARARPTSPPSASRCSTTCCR